MATRTISAAGGNWNDIAAWDEGSVPTAADEVVATSFSGNLTINVAAACRSIDLSSYLGTLTHNANITLSIGDGTAPTGNNALVFAVGMTYTLGNVSTSAISFVSSSATALNIDSGGKVLGNVAMGGGSGGSLKLIGNLEIDSTATMTKGAGVFDANGFDVTIGALSAGGSGVRTITMGSGTWTVTGSNRTVWQVSATNLTINRGNAVVFNYAGSTGTRAITPGTLSEANSIAFRFTAGTDTVTTGAGSPGIRDLIFDGFAGSLGGGGRTIYGNLTVTALSSGMTFSASASATVFAATSGTQTITSGGRTLDFPITVNGVGGTVQLADNLTYGSNRALTITNGTFDANGFDVDGGSVSSSNSNARSILMGSGMWTLRNSGTAWTTATVTNLTFDAETSTITLANSGSQTFAGGGCTFYVVDLGTSGTKTIQGSNTFHTLTRTVTSAATVTFTDGTTQTVTNSLTLTGASGQLLTLQGSSTGGWTIAVPATQNIAYVSVSRSTATGNAAVAPNSTDGGNNVNWVFSPIADFTGTPTSGTAPLTTAFTYTGTGGTPDDFHWEKNDGGGWVAFDGTPTAENPTEDFTAGTWSIRVTASNGGGSDTHTETDYITATAPSSGGVQQPRRLRLGLGMGL